MVVVPQQKAYVVERFGKFKTVLAPGLHFLIPLVDKIRYVHELKEQAINIAGQMAITRDNVTINIDGVLYIRVTDPYNASYGVSDAIYAISQLAQTTMRAEIGKITLDKTFEERDFLNQHIVNAINSASKVWGITCLRYEIRDIAPPVSVRESMDSQASAERKKRTEILESEGQRQAAINAAEGAKANIVLNAEAKATAVLMAADAESKAIEKIADAINQPGGKDAVSYQLAQKYVEAFGNIAKQGNTIILPSEIGNVANMVTQTLGIYNQISNNSSINIYY